MKRKFKVGDWVKPNTKELPYWSFLFPNAKWPQLVTYVSKDGNAIGAAGSYHYPKYLALDDFFQAAEEILDEQTK